jgi:hypothetical protein
MKLYNHIVSLTALSEYNITSGNGADLMDFVNADRVKLPALFVSHKGAQVSQHHEDGTYAGFVGTYSLYCKVRGNGDDDLATIVATLNNHNTYTANGENWTLRVMGYTWLFEDSQRDIFEIIVEVF